ncbi:MAG TPA: hypothetical protein VKW08_10590 [Xanthobacteraceae bacterium]|jgi:hypothetical protein|nr:hypothetical protein [Xanthobacteraceae bacterium]
MSSPKAAAAVHKSRAAAKTVAKPARKPAARHRPAAVHAEPVARQASAEALRLAAEIETGLANGQLDLLSAEALQALMAATCKAYAARVEAGNPAAALAQRTTVSPTEVMVTASGLLRAANLAVFELGMWQSWTGR